MCSRSRGRELWKGRWQGAGKDVCSLCLHPPLLRSLPATGSVAGPDSQEAPRKPFPHETSLRALVTHGAVGHSGSLPCFSPWEGQGKDAAFSPHPSRCSSPALHRDLGSLALSRQAQHSQLLWTILLAIPHESPLISLNSCPKQVLDVINPRSKSPDTLLEPWRLSHGSRCLSLTFPALQPPGFRGSSTSLLRIFACVCVSVDVLTQIRGVTLPFPRSRAALDGISLPRCFPTNSVPSSLLVQDVAPGFLYLNHGIS